MKRVWLIFVVLATLVLAGCDPSDTTLSGTITPLADTAETPTTAAGAAPATDEGQEPTAAITTTATTLITDITATPAGSPTALATAPVTSTAQGALESVPAGVQVEQIEIGQTGELEPEEIRSTPGMTIEMRLANQSANPALLLFELGELGQLGVVVPEAGAAGEETTLPGQATSTPTAPLMLQPTVDATGTPTATGTLEPAIEATTPPTPTTALETQESERVIYLRYQRPGTYRVSCGALPETSGQQAEGQCTGSMTIIIEEAGPAPAPGVASTPEVTGTAELTGTATLTTTPEITGTAELTGTATLTTTPEITGTTELTSTPEVTGTAELTGTVETTPSPATAP